MRQVPAFKRMSFDIVGDGTVARDCLYSPRLAGLAGLRWSPHPRATSPSDTTVSWSRSTPPGRRLLNSLVRQSPASLGAEGWAPLDRGLGAQGAAVAHRRVAWGRGLADRAAFRRAYEQRA